MISTKKILSLLVLARAILTAIDTASPPPGASEPYQTMDEDLLKPQLIQPLLDN